MQYIPGGHILYNFEYLLNLVGPLFILKSSVARLISHTQSYHWNIFGLKLVDVRQVTLCQKQLFQP